MTRNVIIIQLLVAVVAFGSGYLYRKSEFVQTQRVIAANSPLRESGKYDLISPLLACGDTEATRFGVYQALKSEIESLVKKEVSSGKATDVSVYFRTPTGAWVGVNENARYAPASLLKIPLMTAYFKLSENEPGILSKQLSYDGSFDDNKSEVFKSDNLIHSGSYTVYNLIRAMIINSDNNATALLKKNIDPATLSEVYYDLGLPIATKEAPQSQSISAKEYSYFFRVLYNATYLNAADSEKALAILARPSFPLGLRGSVPAGVTVAEKFGERTLLNPDGTVINRELHDCGYLYTPDQTYLLCVMTRGKDLKDLSDVIQSVGRVVYNQITSSN